MYIAYLDGHRCRMNGYPLSDNPYDEDTEPELHSAWNDGWCSPQ